MGKILVIGLRIDRHGSAQFDMSEMWVTVRPLGVALSAALNFRGCRPIVIFLAIVDCAYALAAALGVLVESVFLFWVLPGALLWLLAGFLGLSRSPNEDIHE